MRGLREAQTVSSGETCKYGVSAQLECWDENCWSINPPSHNHIGHIG